MIDFLKGDIASCGKGFVVIEASGVGYYVNVPDSEEYRALKTGGSVKLMTVMSLNDGIPEMFGFLNAIERKFFLEIRSVSSFGARLSMAAISAMPLTRIAEAILSGDKKALKSIPGMGDKKAERLILELKNSPIMKESASSCCLICDSGSELADAEEALCGLGCSPEYAHEYALCALSENPSADAEAIIARALELMK
ncbi:MAG: Holliday junction branch migration protein RuvA [bacterium]|nr:Holliday junction branch migration protein RuvA [bacterium]